MTPAWRRYARFWGARVDADVDDEMRFHMEMLIREYESRGMSPDDARAAAAQRLGDLPGARDACLTIGHRRQRRMARARMIDALVQDVRYAMRTLGRQKGWTTVALLTLALGIGASTAMFSVVNSLVLHPLPYVGADRVRLAWLSDEKSHVMIGPDAEIKDAWRSAHSLDALEDYDTGPLTLTGRGEPRSIQVGRINSSFLKLAGAPIIRGRSFAQEEELRSAGQVAILSEGFWRDEFGASPSTMGQRVTVDGKLLTIIGVVSSKIRLPNNAKRADLWMPMGHDTTGMLGAAVVRLRPGVTAREAEREMDLIGARLGRTTLIETQHFKAKLVKPGDFVGFRESLMLLSGAVALLLLVACANVAHLMLARGATREREFAIRAALGARRGRLARQLVTESLLLASVGCVLGIALGYAGVRALIALRPASLNTLGETHLDWRAVVLALGLSVVTGVVFGLTAALHSIRKTSGESLRATSLTGTATVTRHRLRSLLVVTEMALSAMLLVGAVLLVRSVRNMQRIDVHFDPANLYSLELMLPPARYPKLEANLAMLGQMLERTRHLPSVVGATLANATPPDANYMLSHPESADGKTLPNSSFTSFNAVAPEYFDLLGLRFLRGRTFSPGVGAAAEIIINEGFAQKMWPGEDAIGKRIRFASADTSKPEPWKTVIGVVPNVPMLGLAGDPAKPMFYLDHRTASFLGSVRILVRARPGMDPTAAMKSAVLEVDPRATPPSVETITNALSESIASQRFTMKLLAVFAVLAVVLSAVGLYGVISFVVTQRTREIGIRMALGALPADVARAVAARGLALSLVGLSIGLVGAVWGTKLIKSALFGVTGTDAMSYAATGAALLAVSIIASLVPMRRAMRVDPVIAMRGE